ncbi:MAG: type I polyketide synthase [Leptolyngbya sp. SIOISBB]|nr:type I polyketide synthase [Leptolyngbya sp. SIOISBB]
MRNSLAIVGIGCRFPGGVDSPESFWQLLSRQVDAISEIPANRWQADRFYSTDTETPGKMVTRWGGFLDQVDQFDAQFFRISPREATELDPQQRLLLEVSWEALEHAGIVPEQLRGSRTGVFIGACSTDYFKLRTKLELCDTFNGYSYTGGRPSLLAGRVAYTFDFQGPAMVVDTACSSSLVALHLACQALNTREADAALVGGVNVLLDPGVFILASKLGTQSPAGRCKAFDEQANGFVRSEGCGMLVLKRLEDALQDGSQILAVVRGTGVNQDGNSSSITAPDAQAQATLMRQVLANTELSPTDITYVEAHGTGTPVGDPVEFSSIWEVFGQSHQAHGNQLPVGSVKTNIGHCEAASGIASVIKTVLALQHREIPANLHFQRLNPTIPAEAANMLVPTSTMPWTTPGSKRYAAINSFGFSGTNAHLVLEEAERRERSLPEQTVPAPMLCLSAPSAPALIAQVQRYQEYLSVSQVPLEMICQTANTRRTHFRYRQGFTGHTVEQLQQSLSSFIAVADPPEATSSQQPPKVAFLFTGQGSQSVQMGQQLLASNAVFRETMEMCDRLLRSHLGESLLELIDGSNYPDAEHQLQQTALAQPAIFALEYALYQTWRSWGVTPDIVLGHSVGEYVAACVSGLFSLEQGLALIATRGQLMQALPAGGGMAAVAAPPATIEAVLGGRLPETISVAAINAPDQTVLSGDEETLQGILPILEQQEMTVRRLPVSHGFHSALLEPMLEPLRQALEQVDFGSLHIPLVSNLTGQQMTAQAMGQPDYWLAHTRQAVQFETSMHTLEAAGTQLFVEIGPRPTLINLGQRCLPDSSATWLMSLRPGFNDTQMMAESLVHLYSQGIDPDWRALYPDQSFPMIDLPTYPFQRKRYWSEFAYPATSLTSQPAAAIALTESPVHPLLGYRGQVELNGQTYFQNHLSAQTPPYFVDHQVDDAVIMPGAVYVEMAIAAGSQLAPELSFTVSNLHLKVPIALSTELPRPVQMLLTPQEDRIEFAIASTDFASTTSSPNWIQHATGEIIFEKKSHPSVPLLEEMRPRFQETLDRQSIYAEMEQTGLKYGPSFQGVQELWVTASQTEALGRICLPSNLRADAVNYFLHPVLLDGCSQVSRWADGSNIHAVSKVPFFYESVEIYGKAGDQIWCYVRKSDAVQAGDRNPPVDIFIYDLNGTPIASILGALSDHI